MIIFNDLTFKRMVMHRIIQKEIGQEHATIDPEDKLLNLNEDVINVLKSRMTKATNSASKAFELEVADSSPLSFFNLCHNLKTQPNEVFLKRSIEIAHNLAKSQTKNNIPGGYLILIEAYDKAVRTAYIVIKAELHEVLHYEYSAEGSRIELMDDVFLSPTRKFYKIGLIYEKEQDDTKEFPNNQYGAFLFDDGFSVDSELAEYFYKEFLGFTIEHNAKLQTKRFFDNTESFIKNNFFDSEKKYDLLQALKGEFSGNEESVLTPEEFAMAYFDDEQTREDYKLEIVEYLPDKIIKNDALIKNKLRWRKLVFPNKVVMQGPDSTFDYNAQVITSKDQLAGLDFENQSFTILKIKGKPYSTEFED